MRVVGFLNARVVKAIDIRPKIHQVLHKEPIRPHLYHIFGPHRSGRSHETGMPLANEIRRRSPQRVPPQVVNGGGELVNAVHANVLPCRSFVPVRPDYPIGQEVP